MEFYRFANGDVIFLRNKALIVSLAGRRKIVSTSLLNGGYSEKLKYIFNKDEKSDAGECFLKADTYEAHLKLLAEELNLDWRVTTGLSTAVTMENAVLDSEMINDEAQITVLVTAGVGINGGRVGDPAGFPGYENKSDHNVGTINIFIFLEGDALPGTMNRLLITGTEAKTAALQELAAKSCFSEGLATGTGTDGMVVVADPDHQQLFTEAGKHSLLGEKVGNLVKKTVKTAIFKQEKIDAASQHDFFKRLERFVLGEEVFRKKIVGNENVEKNLQKIKDDPGSVAIAACISHLWDEINWGLLTAKEAAPIYIKLLENISSFDEIKEKRSFASRNEMQVYLFKNLGWIKKEKDSY